MISLPNFPTDLYVAHMATPIMRVKNALSNPVGDLCIVGGTLLLSAIENDQTVITPVSCLLCAGRPPAIRRLVVTVIIDAVN
jgi:hypothetical protein